MAATATTGKCRVDLHSGDVWRDGEIERLPPRLLALMRHLVARRGTVANRDELMAAVWGHLEAASDDSVNVAVSALRRHLGDDARAPRVIETIPRRGYRYTGAGVELADLSALHQADSVAPSATPAATPELDSTSASPIAVPARVRTWSQRASGIAIAALLLGAIGWFAQSVRTPPAAVETTELAGQVLAAPGVAVLPFLDLSPAADQSYLADALVDRIIHVLAQGKGLQVAARSQASHSARANAFTSHPAARTWSQ